MKSCRSVGPHLCATFSWNPASNLSVADDGGPPCSTSYNKLGSFCSWYGIFAMNMASASDVSEYPPWMTTPLALTRTSVNALLACGFPIVMSAAQTMPGLCDQLRYSLRCQHVFLRIALCDYIAQQNMSLQRAPTSDLAC